MADENRFRPPRGGMGSQKGDIIPVQAAFWQPPEAVQKSEKLRYKTGSVFLGWSGAVPVGVNDDRHIMTVAGARAGKTSTLLIPNLHLYKGAALVIDPKGELATKTAQYRHEKLGHTVHVLDPWRQAVVPEKLRGAKFNPLAELAAGDPNDLIDDAAIMAEALIEEGGDNNKHWSDAARDFIRAVILWLVEGPQADGASLARLPAIIADCMAISAEKSDEDIDDDFFEVMIAFRGREGLPEAVGDAIRNAGRGMKGTNPKERATILSTARAQLGFLESGQMRDNLATSTFQLSELKRGKAALSGYSIKDGDISQKQTITIYLCLPAARMGTHSRWLRLFLNMAMTALERDKTVPDFPVLFMLEEFAALGHMRALEQASAYMAGFGVKLWIVLQDLTQLKRHYKEGWETFIGNCGTLTAFGNADMTTLEYLSKRLGDTFTHIRETQNHGSDATEKGAASIRENFQKVALLAPHEIAVDFGRRYMRCMVLIADAPAIALERAYFSPTLFASILKG